MGTATATEQPFHRRAPSGPSLWKRRTILLLMTTSSIACFSFTTWRGKFPKSQWSDNAMHDVSRRDAPIPSTVFLITYFLSGNLGKYHTTIYSLLNIMQVVFI